MKDGSSSMNWLGVVAGALMVVLPFLGPWWIGQAGAGAFVVAFSPFDVSVTLLGSSIHSYIVDLFLLAARIAMILGGAFLILGSLFPKRWWSKRLVKFGIMKPFWAVLGLIILLVLGALIVNHVLPMLLSNLVAGPGGVGGATINLNIPYVVGTSNSTIQIGTMATITAPINFSLTWVFWFAVVVAALAIAARIYHRRFTREQKTMVP